MYLGNDKVQSIAIAADPPALTGSEKWFIFDEKRTWTVGNNVVSVN
jgi:hypothetical protein